MQDTAELAQINPVDLSEESIVERIFEAVIEQRLPPGTKLSESALCEAFGVGRMRIRQSLLLLASRDVVDLRSNRGAYVAAPTPRQALEVFEARRAIEPNVCRHAVERANPEDIQFLETHLEREQEANRQGDRRLAIRLSGGFHIKLAEIAANHVMTRMVKELVTRTSLIIGMFGAAGTANCHEEEHMQLLNAFRDKATDKAANLMITHLEHIEAQIDLNTPHTRDVDLIGLFQR